MKVADKITIPYNQLVQNGNFESASDWYSHGGDYNFTNNTFHYERTGGTGAFLLLYKSTSSLTLVNGRKYVLFFRAKGSANYYLRFGIPPYYDFNITNNWQDFSNLIIPTNDAHLSFSYRTGGIEIGQTLDIQNVILIDLTALGLDSVSTLADFYATPLGKLILDKKYLPYSQEGNYVYPRFMNVADKVSIPYNQLIENGNFENNIIWSANGNYSQVSISNSKANIIKKSEGDYLGITHRHDVIKNHKLLYVFDVYCDSENSNKPIGVNDVVGFNFIVGYSTIGWKTFSCINNSTNGTNSLLVIFLYLGTQFQIKNVMAFDLTSLGLEEISTLGEFYATPLGKLILDKKYLPYSLGGNYVFPRYLKMADTKLPAEYQEVEYIEANGSQYIKTTYIPNNNSGMLLECIFSGLYRDDVHIGVKTAEGHLWQIGRSAIIYKGWNYNDEGQNRGELKFINGVHTLNYLNDRKRITKYSDGYYKETSITSPLNEVDLPAYIFARNDYGTARYFVYNTKIKRVIFTELNEIVHNFVPCYRKSDNVIGMYDLVGKQFYTNQGTGSFTKGNNVYNIR